MNQKTLSPALACLLGGIIYDLSMGFGHDGRVAERMGNRALSGASLSLEFLRDEIARNSVVQSEILFSALEEDFHTPSVYETRMDSIPNLMTLKRGDLQIEGMMWNRLIGHFFERFLIRIKQGVLSQ